MQLAKSVKQFLHIALNQLKIDRSESAPVVSTDQDQSLPEFERRQMSSV